MSLLDLVADRARLSQQLAELAALNRIELRPASPPRVVDVLAVDDDRMLQRVVVLLQSNLGCQGCAVYLSEPPAQQLTLRAASTRRRPETEMADRELIARLAHQAWREGRLVQSDETASQLALPLSSPSSSVRSFLAVPLRVADRPVGVLTLDDDQPDALGDQEAHLLSVVATWVSVALENALRLRQVRAQIEQLEQALEDARRISQVKSDSLHYLSHEVRTPLTFIIGYVELMLDGTLGEINPNIQQALSVINQRTQATIRLVNDVMSLEQVELGKLELEPVSMAEVIANSLEGAKVTAEAAGIQIKAELDANIPLVWADARRLGQVFDNLLANAIKFSSAGGIISVRTFQEGDWVRADVQDTGIGIAPEHLERIFDRFYQVEGASTHAGHTGSGLGLAIVKSVVEAHSGQVTVHSRPGVGSTFSVRLPAWRRPAAESASGKAA